MHSNAEWRYWGQTDPFWAVNSQPGREAGGKRPWRPDEFLDSGTAYFDDVVRQWRQYGIGTQCCIEIGCGAGRITRHLLDSFERVVAVDVSPDQIDVARRLLGTDASRVTFLVVDEPRVGVEPESCDGMFSCEVFQHFSDYSMFEQYLRQVYIAMRPGGTAAFQLPVIGLHPHSPLWQRARQAIRTAARALGVRRMMEYRYFNAPRVLATLRDTGYVDSELRAFPVAEHGGHHAYFFARKPHAGP